MESPTELIAQPSAVLLDFSAASRDAAIRTLHGSIQTAPGVRDAERFLFDLLERAMLSSVCIAPAIAMPHARTDSVDQVVFAAARLAEPGVAFDSEHPKVRLMFLIGTPRQHVDAYLQLVAALSRTLKADGVLAGLLSARNKEEFRGWLARGVKA